MDTSTQPTMTLIPVSGALQSAGAIDPMLDIREVETATKRKKSGLYAAIKTGQFPAPYRVGVRRVAWRASEVQAYLDSLPRVGSEGGAA